MIVKAAKETVKEDEARKTILSVWGQSIIWFATPIWAQKRDKHKASPGYQIETARIYSVMEPDFWFEGVLLEKTAKFENQGLYDKILIQSSGAFDSWTKSALIFFRVI